MEKTELEKISSQNSEVQEVTTDKPEKEIHFRCKCGQGFQQVLEFSKHLDKIPQNCKTFENLDYLSTICFYCNKKFRSKENVQIHIEEVHEKEQPWLIKCTICSELCLDKKVMNDHIVSVHDGKFWYLNQRNCRKSSWCFKCRICPYEATSKPTMEEHVSSEHNRLLVKPKCRLFHSTQFFDRDFTS